jgi:hypothetical protein
MQATQQQLEFYQSNLSQMPLYLVLAPVIFILALTVFAVCVKVNVSKMLKGN